MSLLDQFEKTYITKDWLETNGWSVAFDYSLVNLDNYYHKDVIVFIPKEGDTTGSVGRFRPVPVHYDTGTKTMFIHRQHYNVETVEDMLFIINTLAKEHKL
jgi:hypothetical protein